MSRARCWVAGLWLYVTLLVMTAPATLFDTLLARLSDGRVRLVGAEGTLWSGSGVAEIRTGAEAAGHGTLVRWQLDASRWWSARAGWQLQFANQTQPAQLVAGWRQVELRDFHLSLPAAAASGLLPALQGYGLGGMLQIDTASFVMGGKAAGGTARVHWQDASTRLAPVVPLGAYVLDLQGSAGDIQLALMTAGGPLQLQGQGSLRDGETLRYRIKATLPATEYALLAPFLRLIAVETPNGEFTLSHE